MRAAANYRIRNESTDRQIAAGRYNPGRELTIRLGRSTHTVPIAAGSQDAVSVYRAGAVVYVVSVNSGLGYAGLEAFAVTEDHNLESFGDVFLQNDGDVYDVLGPRGVDLAPYTIARRLAEYLG